MNIQAYLDTLRAKYATGVATEHSYRPALEILLMSAGEGVVAVNEPRRVACGAPDFVVTRKGIDIGHCEAKDLPIDLAKLKDANLDQKKRYLKALPNLIYTNGVDFEFYKEGVKVRSVSIGVLAGGKIEALPDNFEVLANQLKAFAAEHPQSITSAKKLAEMMAGKAILIKDIMGNALRADSHLQTELTGQFAAFKAHLIHDIDADEFADVYAETIAYGLFAARLHDTSLNSFDRREALELLPKSNPFLRSLFGYIAGVDLDDRIAWVIDELCDVLRACNLHLLMQDFGKWTARNDPFLHFYETFLAEYNPAKRKARGVWYTPEPVVNFIVRAVDDVLKSEFGLPMGLADTSKITVDWDTGQTDAKGNRTTIKKDVHRVQILDPATGTGTFLAEAIKQIAAKVKDVAPGMWSSYVEQDLIPRIHGFELLMASYAMCHMKLDMMLADLGYVPSALPPRLSVYLTNSLEEGDVADQQLPFARWLSEEAKGANTIKRDAPIMCVIGNPPYSGESANKGDWIMGLMEAYKMEPGGKVRLEETNSKWINKDEHKFIRFAEHMISKNGEGVLGFITSHGYLTDPTLRGMRWQLLDAFDKIFVLDLHGNSNRREVNPDGQADKNVFDIKQGVAIIIAVKKRPFGLPAKRLATVRRAELWGSRERKNVALWNDDVSEENWESVALRGPHWVFLNRDKEIEDRFETGFSISQLFEIFGNGIVTKRDSLCIQPSDEAVWQSLEAFKSQSESTVRTRYSIPADVRDWRYEWAKSDVINHFDRSFIKPINYRPFDQRRIFYSGNARGFVGWPVKQVMSNYLAGHNIGLLAPKAVRDPNFAHCFVTDQPTEAIFLSGTTGSNAMNFPLYLYPEPGSLETERRVNFDPKIYAAILAAAGLAGDGAAGDPSPRSAGAESPSHAGGEGREVQVFDYIYGVLHSPDYRATYAQFLKIDFPRIPYPDSPEVFAHVAEKGGQLRRLHLMEEAAIGATPYPFVGAGDGVVGKVEFVLGGGDMGGQETPLSPRRARARLSPSPAVGGDAFASTGEGLVGRVRINAEQYFDGVPAVAWGFHIGGYQPAQKWLKDRKGRALGFDDVRHYQKIIKILVETDRIMREIVLPLG